MTKILPTVKAHVAFHQLLFLLAYWAIKDILHSTGGKRMKALAAWFGIGGTLPKGS